MPTTDFTSLILLIVGLDLIHRIYIDSLTREQRYFDREYDIIVENYE